MKLSTAITSDDVARALEQLLRTDPPRLRLTEGMRQRALDMARGKW